MKNTLLAILALAVIALAALAWNLNRHLDEANAARLAADQRALAAQHRTEAMTLQLAESEKARATLEADAKSARRVPVATTGNATPARREAAGMAMLDNPAVQKIMSASFKSSLDQRFASLFRLLKLSPADLDKFKDLLVEKQMSGLDALRVAQSKGMTANPAEMAGLMSKVQGDVDESIRTLLGETGFQTFQDYNQNISSYSLLDQLERRLSYTNAPLQPTQSDALLQIFKITTQASAFERAAPASALAGFVQGFGGANPIAAALTQRPITEATVESAKTVLSEPQLGALRQLQVEQASQTSSLQNMRGTLVPGATGEARVIIPPREATPVPPPKN